jgi:hypothetical protein
MRLDDGPPEHDAEPGTPIAALTLPSDLPPAAGAKSGTRTGRPGHLFM